MTESDLDSVIGRVTRAIQGHRYRFTSEAELQAGIDQVLRDAGLEFRRECVLSDTDRLDFFVDDRVAVEIKIKGSLTELMRQVAYYAEYPQIESVVVVTSKNSHRGMPQELCGKPIHTLVLNALA